jgi:hypothetical protein
MDDFSYGQAIGAGFRVIGRRPLAVLTWAAVYLVLVVAPAVAMLAVLPPKMLGAMRDMGAHTGPPTAAQLMAALSVLSHAASFAAWRDVTPESFDVAVRPFGPVITAAVVVAAVVSMAVHAILLAPLAQIYRGLTEEPAAA